MRKETAKDIAIALIASSGLNFDPYAFDECEGITKNERDKILEEIQNQCRRMLNKIENKHNTQIRTGTTKWVVDAIVFNTAEPTQIAQK